MAIEAEDASYWRDLVECGYDEHDSPCAARFGRLSRLNIAYLFNELIKIKDDIRVSGTSDRAQLEKLSSLMHRYGQ